MPGPFTQGLLVVVLDLFELGVDHIIGVGLAFTGVGLGIALGSLLFVHLLYNRSGCFGQRVDLRFDLRLIVTLDRFFQFTQRLLDGRLHATRSGREHQFRTHCPKQRAALDRHRFGHGEDQAVALGRGDEGQGSLSDHGVANRFLQLGYPWLGWSGSRGLPENLEPPDGAIAGMIARSTLLRGAFHSAAGSTAYELERVHPVLSRAQREREPDVIPASGGPIEGALFKRLSLVGHGLHRFELLSDVTSSGDTRHQLGGIQRLNAIWIRALEQAGQSLLFEPSSEATWAQVRRALTDVGMALFRGGAFRGESPSQAFRVRCDRTTMSQRDIDSARLVAEIEYRPVAPVELIRVFLSLTENREVSVLSEASEMST